MIATPMRFSAYPVSWVVVALFSLVTFAGGSAGWHSQSLHDQFFAEGAAFGDIDGDGQGDLVSGPFWWKGPAFEERHAFYDTEPFDVGAYSDNFFSHVHDIDGDGDQDILVFGFPGKGARLYLNPGDGGFDEMWEVLTLGDLVCHESPDFVDIVPGGLPEIVCSRGKAFGFYEAGEDPTQSWHWRPISKTGEAHVRFGHGLGVGDLDGDGDLDIVDRFSWWENPGASELDGTWRKYVWAEESYGRGGAQIIVHDVDGDGLNDLVSSLDGHGYGLAWFRQVKGLDGESRFERNDIMGDSSIMNPYGVAFSQLHAVALRDIDGDGLKDIVTGKRWYAHNGKDVGGNQEAVLYWFQCRREEGKTSFIPYRIDHDSGVGVDVLVEDLDGDGRLDVVSANKKGVKIHFQRNGVMAEAPERWQVPGGRPDDDWADSLSPKAAARTMEVPEGFAVDLIASEPDIVQPIAMCFDAKGRIWVVEAKTYPQRLKGEEGKDRILILEDKDSDGSFESKKVFADNLNLVSGIEIGFGGVWVGAAPYLLFFPDANGDDVPDGEPEVLLDGWAYHDTHETLNSFTWGPDGWLYGCHGVFNKSKVGKPGTTEAQRQAIDAGIWRYHPTRHTFEVFAWGISNPWGLDFDEKGNWFASACVIPHYYHVIQGGRYFRQAGQHYNPYVYQDIETIADHLHYGDGTLNSMRADGKVDRALQREKAADTSAVGGGHAHCGLVIYQGQTFPESYRGDSFFFNLHGHRIVRESLERDGSGFVARHRPDFALAKDHAFVGVGLMLGPDGALYASDWHDPQTCHHRNYEIWDRTDGRIFRIRYGEYKSVPIDLPASSDLELVDALTHENTFIARQAQRLLQERAFFGTFNSQGVEAALKTQFNSDAATKLRLRSLWAQQVCGLLDEDDLYSILDDEDPAVRSWAIHFFADAGAEQSARVLEKLTELARLDPSSDTRRYLSAALQRLPESQRWSLVEALSSRSEDLKDRNLPLMVWYGFEPLVSVSPSKAIALVSDTQWPDLRTFTHRRAAVFPEGRDALLAYVAAAESPLQFLTRGKQYLEAMENQDTLERPKSWNAFLAKGNAFATPKVNTMSVRIRARLGDEGAFAFWRARLEDEDRTFAERREALELLKLGGDDEIGATAASLLSEAPFRSIALATLPRYLNMEIGKTLMEALPDFSLEERNEGINLLASRADTTVAFLESIQASRLNASLVSPALMRQMRRHGDERIEALMDSIWGVVKQGPANLSRQVRRWKFALTPEYLGRADPSYGRHVFKNTCGACHQLFGEGVALGPDLTGSNRANLDYLLENVLAPNAIVGKDYQLNVVTTTDGRVISGILLREDEGGITIGMVGGAEISVRLDEVARRELLDQSMMPSGLFDALPEGDVAALVAYLGSAAQVEEYKPQGEDVR